jgi:beta-galactosidase
VKTKAGDAGKVTLTASADGLEGAQVTLETRAQ